MFYYYMCLLKVFSLYFQLYLLREYLDILDVLGRAYTHTHTEHMPAEFWHLPEQ